MTQATVIEAAANRGVPPTRRNGCCSSGSHDGSCPDVGRFAITPPRFAQLENYLKPDGRRGARVVCEDNGVRHGVTIGVLERFAEIGTYHGWAYVDAERRVVFRFLEGIAGDPPESLAAIDTPTDRVLVPPDVCRGLDIEHGELVAFYARSVAQRRRATHLFRLDAEHLPLIANLINSKKLVFPDHLELLQVLYDGLEANHISCQYWSDVDAALATLSEEPELPEEFRKRARVERGNLSTAEPKPKPRTEPQIRRVHDGDTRRMPRAGRRHTGPEQVLPSRIDL